MKGLMPSGHLSAGTEVEAHEQDAPVVLQGHLPVLADE